MPKIAPETDILTISDRPQTEEDLKKKERDDSVAALREFFKELFRYLFTLLCFSLVIFLDSNWSQKHSSLPLTKLQLISLRHLSAADSQHSLPPPPPSPPLLFPQIPPNCL
jgi:hypothetical protein